MGRKKELKSWRNLGKVGEGRGEGAQENHRNEKWDEGRSEESNCTAAAHTLNPRTEGEDRKEGQKKAYDETRKERSM